MLLIMEAVGQRETRTDEEGRALYQRMLDFSADLKSLLNSVTRCFAR